MTHWNDRVRFVACFINPIGGSWRAEEIFETKLRPKMEMVGITYEKIVTTSPTFMEEYFRALTPETCPYTDFAVIGGDGLLHQF